MVAYMLIKYFRDNWSRSQYNSDDEENVQGKVVVITGSNSGIGEATAMEMAKRGAIVVMACRDMRKAEKVIEKIKFVAAPESGIELLALDLGDLSSVRSCATKIKSKYERIDILINNAGVVFDDGQIRKTKDGFEMHMGINHLGHFLFTILLLDLVKKGAPSRIINVASTGFEMADLNVNDLMLEKRGNFGIGNSGPYCDSKLANIYFTRALAKKMEGQGVTVYSLCPGMVNTDLNRNSGSWIGKKILGLVGLTSAQGAETILFCAMSKTLKDKSGTMYRFCKPLEIIKVLDDKDERCLWEKSEKLVGI